MLKIVIALFILKYWFLIAFSIEQNDPIEVDKENPERCLDCELNGECPIVKEYDKYSFNRKINNCYLKNRLQGLRKDYEF